MAARCGLAAAAAGSADGEASDAGGLPCALIAMCVERIIR
jgi:hypothetical protein